MTSYNPTVTTASDWLMEAGCTLAGFADAHVEAYAEIEEARREASEEHREFLRVNRMITRSRA